MLNSWKSFLSLLSRNVYGIISRGDRFTMVNQTARLLRLVLDFPRCLLLASLWHQAGSFLIIL